MAETVLNQGLFDEALTEMANDAETREKVQEDAWRRDASRNCLPNAELQDQDGDKNDGRGPKRSPSSGITFFNPAVHGGKSPASISQWLSRLPSKGGHEEQAAAKGGAGPEGLRKRQQIQAQKGPGGRSMARPKSSKQLTASGGRGRRGGLARRLHGLRSKALNVLHHVDRTLPIIHPKAGGKVAWDVFIMMFIIFNAITVPIDVSYGFTNTPLLNDLNYGINILFMIDICISFRTAFFNKQGQLVRESGKIAANYSKFWFPIDLAASLPYDLLAKAMGFGSGAQTTVLGFLKAPRLLRLGRLVRLLDHVKNVGAFKVVLLIAIMVLISHWMACIWYMLFLYSNFTSGVEEWAFDVLYSDSVVSMYLWAYAQSFLIVMGNGQTPMNNAERVFFIVCGILGTCFYSAVVGQMALLVANMNVVASRHSNKEDLTMDVLRYAGVPPTEVARVRKYFNYIIQYSHPTAEGLGFLYDLPKALFGEIADELFKKALYRIPIFENMEEPFLTRVSMKMKIVMFTPREVIFKAGDLGQEMYIIRKGCIAVVGRHNQMLAMLTEGQTFGEIAMLTPGARRTANAVALSNCDLCVLHSHELKAVMRDFPRSARQLEENVSMHVRQLQAAGRGGFMPGDESEEEEELSQHAATYVAEDVAVDMSDCGNDSVDEQRERKGVVWKDGPGLADTASTVSSVDSLDMALDELVVGGGPGVPAVAATTVQQQPLQGVVALQQQQQQQQSQGDSDMVQGQVTGPRAIGEALEQCGRRRRGNAAVAMSRQRLRGPRGIGEAAEQEGGHAANRLSLERQQLGAAAGDMTSVLQRIATSEKQLAANAEASPEPTTASAAAPPARRRLAASGSAQLPDGLGLGYHASLGPGGGGIEGAEEATPSEWFLVPSVRRGLSKAKRESHNSGGAASPRGPGQGPKNPGLSPRTQQPRASPTQPHSAVADGPSGTLGLVSGQEMPLSPTLAAHHGPRLRKRSLLTDSDNLQAHLAAIKALGQAGNGQGQARGVGTGANAVTKGSVRRRSWLGSSDGLAIDPATLFVGGTIAAARMNRQEAGSLSIAVRESNKHVAQEGSFTAASSNHDVQPSADSALARSMLMGGAMVPAGAKGDDEPAASSAFDKGGGSRARRSSVRNSMDVNKLITVLAGALGTGPGAPASSSLQEQAQPEASGGSILGALTQQLTLWQHKLVKQPSSANPHTKFEEQVDGNSSAVGAENGMLAHNNRKPRVSIADASRDSGGRIGSGGLTGDAAAAAAAGTAGALSYRQKRASVTGNVELRDNGGTISGRPSLAADLDLARHASRRKRVGGVNVEGDTDGGQGSNPVHTSDSKGREALSCAWLMKPAASLRPDASLAGSVAMAPDGGSPRDARSRDALIAQLRELVARQEQQLVAGQEREAAAHEREVATHDRVVHLAKLVEAMALKMGSLEVWMGSTAEQVSKLEVQLQTAGHVGVLGGLEAETMQRASERAWQKTTAGIATKSKLPVASKPSSGILSMHQKPASGTAGSANMGSGGLDVAAASSLSRAPSVPTTTTTTTQRRHAGQDGMGSGDHGDGASEATGSGNIKWADAVVNSPALQATLSRRSLSISGRPPSVPSGTGSRAVASGLV